MAAIYAVYTSPNHQPVPNHLPTLIVTPHGQPSNILYSYLHTNFNAENYLLTPSPQGDLCVAKLYPPRQTTNGSSASSSDPGHASTNSSRVVRCEASRNLKWSIVNTGVMSPIYKLSLPSPDSADLPLFQISKPNPNAQFWSMFYFAYAGHLIPPKRIEFGRIQKNPPGPGGGGTRISISGKTTEEKAVWQTLGEGNEDCVEWVVLCAALNLLDDEILKAAEKAPQNQAAAAGKMAAPQQQQHRPVQLQDGAPNQGQRPPPTPLVMPNPNGRQPAPHPMAATGGPRPAGYPQPAVLQRNGPPQPQGYQQGPPPAGYHSPPPGYGNAQPRGQMPPPNQQRPAYLQQQSQQQSQQAQPRRI